MRQTGPPPRPLSTTEFVVPAESAGERLDRFLSERLTDLSRAQIQRLVERGEITLDGAATRPAERLKPGQVIRVAVPEPEPVGIVPTEIPLNIVYEHPEFVVVNKPAGLVVHPAPGHPNDTLANALMARYPNLAVGNAQRPGIVHRLDKGTSGLMVAALSDRAFHHFVEQMKNHETRKEYLGLVHGEFPHESGVIEAPIGRDHANRQKMGIVKEGREARTHFRVVERFPDYTLMRFILETGRTHQIRVHAASVGYPIVGDVIYGPRKPGLNLTRPFLHSARLGFQVPGEECCLVTQAPLPEDLERVLERLRDGEEEAI
ncbi:MAG TPA: RluA family pseudouridine synthase [Chloroflexota bacterium]|nr:RluA family pseudouridine synthase [Chloroflexota bacterium]